MVGQLITASMAGYAFAKLRFRGRSAMFWMIISTLMVPIQATIIPVFILIKYMHLTDSLAALIVPAVVSAFGTFLLRQSFMQMPKAVSYTHLCRASANAGGLRTTDRPEAFVWDDVVSVSYTHLDVYKRQAFWSLESLWSVS